MLDHITDYPFQTPDEEDEYREDQQSYWDYLENQADLAYSDGE